VIENDVRIATILDCEGWITLQKVSGSGGVGLVLTLGVGNTNHKLTDWLKTTYGGSVYKTERPHIEHKDYYTWRINGTKAKNILISAVPHLLLKDEQAKLAIHFQETMHSKNSYNEPCTPQYIEYMHSLKKKLNQLNRKGKAVSPATTERDNTSESCEATV
jgi:hypothetical protein